MSDTLSPNNLVTHPVTGWVKLDIKNLPNPKEGPFLVTNNIKARNAHGRMSHVYLTNMMHDDKGPQGPISAFAEPSGGKIWNVTHYMRIASPEDASK